MRSVDLIDFPDDLALELESGLAAAACRVNRRRSTGGIPTDTVAALVHGDRPDWLRFVRDIRAGRPDILVVVLTKLPDHGKWLDALEAGADDYCCLPLGRQEIGWLFGSDSQLPVFTRGGARLMKLEPAPWEAAPMSTLAVADLGAGISAYAIELERLYAWAIEAAGTANAAGRDLLTPLLKEIRIELDSFSGRQRAAAR
jgi:CheY-like chemotaxis protein